MSCKKSIQEQIEIALKKNMAMDWFEKHSIIAVDAENKNACIHYLLYHSFNNKGLVKFINALLFYMDLKRGYLQLSKTDEMKIYINYGREPNEYRKVGMLPLCRFNPDSGFIEF